MKNNRIIHRLLAFIIDLFIVIVIIIISGVAFSLASIESENMPLIMILVMYLSFCSKDMFKGQSIGKRVLNIRVANMQSGKNATFFQCFIRNLTVLIWPIEVFMILRNPERRLGDYVVGTKIEYIEKRVGFYLSTVKTRMNPSSIPFNRAYAFCIDLVLVLILCFPFFAFILAVWPGDTSELKAVSQIALLLSLFIFGLLMLRDCPNGQSPGKRVVGLRVVITETRQIPSISRLMLRNLPIVLIPIDFILVQLQFLHRTKIQRVGDRIADTDVILEKDFLLGK